ncbi:MAG: alpha/beta hydrolase [Saprospiraceae bacterium]|nr:alpha/beta hydrolase [Saprospiraceae bacterium]
MPRQRHYIDIYLHTLVSDERPIYLSGTFNDWAEADSAYQMTEIGPGKFHFQFPLEHHSPIYYRYHKGDWNQEELDRWGNVTAPRKIDPSSHEIHDRVPRWRINGLATSVRFMPQKFIIEDDFEIPQLGKRRRIWALVPCDYYRTKKRYPVLYLQDAQNLFNEHAPFGNWAIDQKMGILKELGFGDLIIIAIEHGGHDRIKEYSPFDTERFGPGEGSLYAQFIVETLKPYVDRKFRSEPHRIHTGIGGSSMGGLISVYTAINYPEVFSKWMIFSPSLWLSSQIFREARDFENNEPSFVYLYGGKNESSSMEKELLLFTEILQKKAINNQFIHYKLSIDPKATHNETFWGAEFPKAVKWLFFDND